MTAVLVLLIGLAPATRAATFVVDSPADAADAVPGDGLCATETGACALRAAIQEANAFPDADRVELLPATYTLSIPGTNEDAAASGDLDILSDLTLTGSGTGMVIIDGGGLDRVLDILAPANVVISQITVQNGNAAGTAGGGIRNTGTLALTALTIRGNTATDGGGIANVAAGSVQLTNVTLSSNTAARGGGIANCPAGAAPCLGATAQLANVTISDNSATTGAGVHNFGTVQLLNTIVGNSPIGFTCAGRVVISLGHNIDRFDTCLFRENGDLHNTDPMLDALRDNGGSTLTHALLPGSPAIDAGDNAGCPATDQRGAPRPTDGNADGAPVCDIGAVEAPGAVGPTATATTTGMPAGSPTDTPPLGTPTISPTVAPPATATATAAGTHTAGPADCCQCSDPRLCGVPVGGGCGDCVIVFRASCVGSTGECVAFTPTPTPSHTPSRTPTVSSTTTPTTTPLPSSTPTLTPTSAATATVRPTATKTAADTPTATPTRTATVTPTIVPSATPTSSPCAGDCNGSGTITVDEVVTLVNIALGGSEVTSCEAGDQTQDGRITIDEILRAVNNALRGCAAASTP
ncbi:MAG: choice-of-anchor Q domain-containing protein [Candidatus Binatia bacterium]